MRALAMVLMLALGGVCLVLASRPPHQEPAVVIVYRGFGAPPNTEWREQHRVNLCTGWLGILIRNPENDSILPLKIVWPVPASCTTSDRRAE